MSLTVREAAAAVGMSKAAIFKAIRTGKMSAQKNANGEWQIEPVELFRVFTPVHSVNSNGHSEVQESTQAVHTPSAESLAEKVSLLERIIETQAVTIEVLQGENSRQAAVIAELSPPKPRPGWWARLLGG